MCFCSTKFYVSLKANMDLMLQVNYSLIVNALIFWFMMFIMLNLIKISLSSTWFQLFKLWWRLLILNDYWTINAIILFWLIIWWKWHSFVYYLLIWVVYALRWLYWLLLCNKQQGTWLQDGEGRRVVPC